MAEINGGNGNDIICGSSGNDVINGGNGNDIIAGGSGNDVIDGGNGNDIIDGGTGNDTIDGGNGNDIIDGGTGDDSLNGENGNDLICGGSGNDILDGGNGNDILIGGSGSDTLRGGKGNDILIGGTVIFGGDDSLTDKAAYLGDLGAYTVTQVGTKMVLQSTNYIITKNADGSLIVKDLTSNGEGTDTLYNIELLQFHNQTYTVSNLFSPSTNNNAPVLTVTQLVPAVNENATGIAVATFSATDADGNALIYSLSGADAAKFSIVGNQVVLTNPADYEVQHTLTVTLTVSDGLAAHNQSQAIALNVNNLNDNNPVLTVTPLVAAVNENATGIAVATFSATDADGDALTYSLSGADAAKFSIVGNQVVLTNPADYEVQHTLTVTLTVSDGLAAHNQSQALIIGVNDLNDTNTNAPVLTVTPLVAAVNENATGIAVATFSATDADGDALTYSLSGSDAAKFSIVGNQVVLTNPADYEIQHTLNVILTASDGLPAHDQSQAIVLNVNNLNDNAPVLTVTPLVAAVNENATGIAVATFSATDADGDALTYSLSGSDAAKFSIVGNQVVLTNPADYEIQHTLNVILTASDGLPAHDQSQAITLNVNNLNDNAPVLTVTPVTSVNENATGDPVATFSATDADGDPLTYSLSGADAAKFTIVGNQVFLTTPADYEVQHTLNVTLTASDGLPAHDQSQAITLNVNNLNDNAPIANNDAYTAYEDTPLVIPAPTGVLANDTDADGNPLSASLVVGPTHGSVIINADGSFTYTPTANYSGADSFTYQGSDGSFSSGVATVNIIVEPEADAPTLTIITPKVDPSFFKVLGVVGGDRFGSSVSSAGDINNDGFDDIIIGAPFSDSSAGFNTGSAYVLFGKAGGFGDINMAAYTDIPPNTFADSGLGFKITGALAGDQIGFRVSSAGDVNNDGFDDLLLSANIADPLGRSGAGTSYVVFGKATGFTDLNMASFTSGSAGFQIFGAKAADFSGVSVSSAGDINNDGFDDVIIGAYRSDPFSKSEAGTGYVIFGKASGFADIDLNSFTSGSAGFKIFGSAVDDNLGQVVSSAGDINNDGFDDIIVSASGAALRYVVFGKASGFADIDLSAGTLTSSGAGFVISGGSATSFLSKTISSAGDINNDGFDDLLIGRVSGNAYVILGHTGGFTDIDLTTFTSGSAGFISIGGSITSVNSAGDINNDGFNDIILGSESSGTSYVVFGKASGFTDVNLSLATFTSSGVGFKILGAFGGNFTHSVSSAGDINNDGFGDLVIGGETTNVSYVVFGHAGGFTDINLSGNGSIVPINFSGALIDTDGSETLSYSITGVQGTLSAGTDLGGGHWSLTPADIVNLTMTPSVSASFALNVTATATESDGSYASTSGDIFVNGQTSTLGTAADNIMTGTSGVDVLYGLDGNDTLNGNGGADILHGGNDNDTLIYNPATLHYDGGNGYDTLQFTGTSQSLDLTTAAKGLIQDIEKIDLTGIMNNSLTLDFNSVEALSSTSHTLDITGSNSSTVTMGAGWTAAGTVVVDSVLMNHYIHGDVAVNIQQGVTAIFA